MARREWKTLRVVVELPVLGDLTEKQLADEVKAALLEGQFYERVRHHRPHSFYGPGFWDPKLGPERARTGLFHVKQFSRVKAALTRTIFGRL